MFCIYIIFRMKRSGTKAKYSPMEQASVFMVQFTTMSEDLLQNWSVTEITESKLYQGEGLKPASGSPNDLKLGVSSQDQKCQTCGETKQCQGHFGHIKLYQPVFHYGFLKYIQKILRCVCHSCFKLKTPTTQTQVFAKKLKYIQRIENNGKKLNELTKLLQNISQCKVIEKKGSEGIKTGCGMPIPIKVSLKNYKFYAADPDNPKTFKVLQRMAIKRILEQVSKQPQTCKFLGFQTSKPEDLMIQTLAIPPPQIRPSIQMNPQKKAEDDITSAYLKILKLNNELKKVGAQVQKNIKIDELQKTIASIMIKLNRAKLEKTAGLSKKKVIKAYKSISDRLKGKQGRFRQNLMGKRVDFSARSVISGDSNLALDELGVPQKIASRLTVPEEVTKWNYDRIVRLCKQGKVQVLLKPPEDRLRDNEKPINIGKLDADEMENYINYGMIAERSLQNGDYVLFNRQPTLHRMSMMGHRVKILPYNTFRLNLSVCTPYNADFDGDEMNMHVPQTFETISELKNIAHVPKQIIAPKNNAPVMGMVQDALLGVYLFTMRDTFLTRQQIMNLVIWIEGKENRGSIQDLLPGQLPIPAILKPEPLWTGKQVMSLIIPKKITIEIKKGDNPLANVKDISMIIKNGELITGALQKEVVGSGAGGLVHSIWLQISPDATNQFISVAQRIVNNWLISSSFTVGASDIALDNDFADAIKNEEEEIKKLFYNAFNDYRNIDEIEKKNLHQRGKKVIDSFQFFINQKLNSKLTTAQDGVKKYVSPYINNIFKMITAKSKGSETNLAQIMYLVGNQNVDGKRCPLGFSKRALPHFVKDDNSPQPRGFVFSSFYKGLKPHQFFFHSMGGREGLSDTAVKTSRTGYIQRKLVKSLEDLVVKYDGTVRDSRNNFLQKMYGEDGFLSEYIEKHRFPGAEMNQKDFEKNFKWQDDDLVKLKYSVEQSIKLGEQYQKLLNARRRSRQIFVNGKDTTQIEYYCPIKIQRLLNKIKAVTYSEKQPIDPYFVYMAVEKLINNCIPAASERKFKQLQEKLEKVTGKGKKVEQKKMNMIRQFEQEAGIQMFRIHLRHNLASKKLCEKKITKQAFSRLIQQIQYKFHQSLAPAGQSIGAIAAQSIGQPTTQMTLNTFHLAGVSDKNVTLGVPRLQQLLDASKNIKTPNMTIHLKNKIYERQKISKENRQRILEMIMQHLPQRHVKDYIHASRLYYDYNYIDSNAGFSYRESSGDVRRLPLVLNIQFNAKKITLKSLWTEIMEKIQSRFRDQFEVIQHRQFSQFSRMSQQQTQNPQLALRLLDKAFSEIDKKQDKKDYENIFTYINRMEQQIKNLSVGGIPGIKSVKTSKRFIMTAPENSKTNLNDKQKQQYEVVVFQTDGSNLKACLSHPQIDPTKTISNDMTQIYTILGIQAARQCFINQFKQIIKPYGIYVNYRHLSVLTDWMSMRGFITPVNRNGINRVKDVSVLRKASYEQTADILFSAAVFSQRDYLRGVSQKVIFGQPVEMGTSSFKVMIDTSEVAQYKAKAGIDKNQALGEQNISGDISYRGAGSDYLGQYIGDRTPLPMNTPFPYENQGGFSTIGSKSPGIGSFSPSFATPMRQAPSFTPSHLYNVGMSPGPVQRTPIPTLSYNSGAQTPISTPYYYNIQNYNSMQTPVSQRFGDLRHSGNRNMGSSSSPSYSDRISSQSPSYTPLSSHNSSPSYGSQRQSNRQQNDSVKNQEDDENEPYDEF